MTLRGIVFTACMLAWPALAAAQTYADGGGDRSIIRPAGYGWRNYVAVPDGPCGCAMPVRADCYDPCRPCGLRPLCFVKRVGRMLDCLLPCNLCCHGGCCGTGPMHGCVLGGHWGHGGCAGGCCPNPAGSCFDDICCSPGPSCGCNSCTSSVPAFSDPFRDDPVPPKPTAYPSHEVRRTPSHSRSVMMPPQRPAPARPTTTAAPRSNSPYKITNSAGQPIQNTAQPMRSRSTQSVLRQTSHELAEPAPHWIDQNYAKPIIRSQSPPETADDFEIPYNPLRAR